MKTVIEGGIRIAQFSDLHFAAETLAEVGPCFESAVSDAIREKVDVAIITGDSTDHRLDAHSPALLKLFGQVQRLANHCPVLLLQGTFSHEPAGMLHLFKYVGAKHAIEVVDRIGQLALFDDGWQQVRFPAECEGARLVVSAVPTVNRADLVASFGVEAVATAMGDVLAGLMSGVFAPMNRAVREMGIPTVLIGHGTVSGSMTESGVPMAGLDHEFTLGGLYSAMCAATMLGHIHRHQRWERAAEGIQQVVAYPGSIGRNHWGEQGEKGFLIWTVNACEAAFEFFRTPSCRMIDFQFDGAPELEYLKANAADCQGAFVRVSYRIDEEFASTVDRKAIVQLFRQAADVKIDGRVMPTVRRRAPGISRLSSLALKAQQWCETTDNDASDVIPRLEMLQTMDPKAISNQILKGLVHEANSQSSIGSGLPVGDDVFVCGPV